MYVTVTHQPKNQVSLVNSVEAITIPRYLLYNDVVTCQRR